MPHTRSFVAVALVFLATSCGRCSRHGEGVTALPDPTKPTKTHDRGSPYFSGLPADAAIYGTVRLDALDALWRVLPNEATEKTKRELERQLGTTLTKEHLTGSLALDASRPAAFAMVPGASSELRAILQSAKHDGATHAAIDKALAAANALPRPPLGALRVVLPVTHGADLEPLFDVLRTTAAGSVKSCKAPTDCVGFGAQRPVFFSADTAVYRVDDTVRVDRLFERTEDEASSARWLASVGASSGGPIDRCQSIEDDALVTLCLSTPALVAWGEASGSYRILSALRAPGIDESMAPEIFDEGVKEMGQASTLAEARAGDLDDGTYALRLTGERLSLEGSFRIGARTPSGFDAERCAKSADDLGTKLLDPLRAALVPQKQVFSTMGDLRESVLECGGAGWGILAAGQWTLALPFLDASTAAAAPFEETCARVADGRLRLRATSDTKSLAAALR